MTRQRSDVEDAKGEADPAVPLPCALDITEREQVEPGTQVLAATQAAQDQLPADWLLTALRSIGDAVIATDAAGHVRFLNQVATDLTGWVPEEAIGQPLDHIFRIVNEATRSPVENPVEKVLETGHIVGLANHTVLIPRDTTERHVDDSAAPIQDERGHITGVILVFRDMELSA
jgi:PAS domain S-box-containing protein